MRFLWPYSRLHFVLHNKIHSTAIDVTPVNQFGVQLAGGFQQPVPLPLETTRHGMVGM